MTIRARVTGTLDGERRYRWWTFERVDAVEFGFSPGTATVQPGERPAQARIWHGVWNPQLGRFERHVSLVVQEDVPLIDIAGQVTIYPQVSE